MGQGTETTETLRPSVDDTAGRYRLVTLRPVRPADSSHVRPSTAGDLPTTGVIPRL